MVEIVSVGLMLTKPDGSTDIWPYDSFTVMSAKRDGNRIAVSRVGASDERLTIAGSGVRDALDIYAPQHRRKSGRDTKQAILVSLAIIATLAGLYFAYPVLKNAVVAVIPESWAVAWGEAVVDSVPGTGDTCDDPAGMAVLQRLTEALTVNADLPYDARVRVDKSRTVNAFAAPGGQVVLLSGLITDAETMDEVAGVLAHELGHVRHKHALKRLIDIFGIQIVFSGIGGDLGTAGGLIMVLSYGRDDEREADETGIEILKKAGMPADGLVRFFDRLATKRAEMPNFSDFLSTHPSLNERSMATRAMVGDYVGKMPFSEEDWQALRWICGDPDADNEEAEEAEGTE